MKRTLFSLMLVAALGACGESSDSSPDRSGAIGDAADTEATAGSDADGEDAPDGSGGLPFAATCSSNDDCESQLCFSFPSKGMRCTKSCGSPAECPAASVGCNSKGICSVP
jgi:hypothetical protein